jgi:methylamine utilization protein MauE
MSAVSVADGARWALVAVFALAAVEKFSSLHSGTAAWHPVMLVSRRRRQAAKTLMGSSLCADILAILLLLISPLAGGLLSIALVAAYSVAGKRVHMSTDNDGCRCFWRILNTSTGSGFVVRNAFLVALAASVATLSPVPSAAGTVWGVIVLAISWTITRLADRWDRIHVESSHHAPETINSSRGHDLFREEMEERRNFMAG